MIKQGSQTNYDIDSDDYVAAIFINAVIQLEPLQAKLQKFANSMIDSGSVCSIITKFLANKILKSTLSARWVTTKWDRSQNILLWTDKSSGQNCSQGRLQWLDLLGCLFNSCTGWTQTHHWKRRFQ